MSARLYCSSRVHQDSPLEAVAEWSLERSRLARPTDAPGATCSGEHGVAQPRLIALKPDKQQARSWQAHRRPWGHMQFAAQGGTLN